MAQQKVVTVTGASGFVGRHVVRELLTRGFSVRALVRDRAKAAQALPPRAAGAPIEIIVGDALEPRDARAACAGADACIHLVGILREHPRDGVTFQRAHVDATRNVLAACRDAGVGRFLHMSALGVCDDGVCGYQRTKWAAEQLVRDSGLDWTIFRPGLIHGEGSHFMDVAEGLVSGHEMPWFFMPYFTRGVADPSVPMGGDTVIDPLVAPVLVTDVARAFVAALNNERAIGEIYNLVGSETLSWPDMLRFIRDTLPGGHDRLEPFGVPSKLAALKFRAMNLVGLGDMLPFDDGMALMGGQDATASLDKASEHLGVTFAPFRTAMRAYAPAEAH